MALNNFIATFALKRYFYQVRRFKMIYNGKIQFDVKLPIIIKTFYVVNAPLI